MVFRLNYSTQKHIPERNIYTDKMIDRMVIEKGKLGVAEFIGVKDIKKMKTSHILPIRSISDYETFVKYMFSDNQSLF